jgi:hypothetical protein
MALIGLAVLGTGGYFLMGVDLKSKLPAPPPVATTTVAPPTAAETQAAQAPAPAPVDPAPQQQQSTLQPSSAGNAGLDAVLDAGKKK